MVSQLESMNGPRRSKLRCCQCLLRTWTHIGNELVGSPFPAEAPTLLSTLLRRRPWERSELSGLVQRLNVMFHPTVQSADWHKCGDLKRCTLSGCGTRQICIVSSCALPTTHAWVNHIRRLREHGLLSFVIAYCCWTSGRWVALASKELLVLFCTVLLVFVIPSHAAPTYGFKRSCLSVTQAESTMHSSNELRLFHSQWTTSGLCQVNTVRFTLYWKR